MSRAYLLTLLALCSACNNVQSNAIQIRLTPAQRERAVFVAYSVREQTCEGREIFRSGVSLSSPSVTPTMPQRLPPGRYAVSVTVRDHQCQEYAAGCALVQLPLAANAPLTVEAVAIDVRAECAPEVCRAGECIGTSQNDAGLDGNTNDAFFPLDSRESATTDAPAIDTAAEDVPAFDATVDSASPTCTPGRFFCARDVIFDCDESGQAQRVRACALGCNSSGQDCLRLRPAHADGAFERRFESERVSEWSLGGTWPRWLITTDDGGIVRIDVNGNARSVSAQELGLIDAITPSAMYIGADSFTVLQHAVVEITGARPLIIRSKNNATLHGTIILRASCNTGARSAVDGATAPFSDGNSMTGGGGGGSCTGGGIGGGTNNGNIGGAGGRSLGTPPWLGPLMRGGSGGAGRARGQDLLPGGCGGGALQISANRLFDINATTFINASGEGGLRGTVYQGGAGAGAGGTIYLEAPEFVVSGGLLSASGAGGGGGANQNSSGVNGMQLPQGGTGGSGATSIPFGGRGGDGSATDDDGRPGGNGSESGGGGGGGGAGYIVFSMGTPDRAAFVNLRTYPSTPMCSQIVRADREE